MPPATIQALPALAPPHTRVHPPTTLATRRLVRRPGRDEQAPVGSAASGNKVMLTRKQFLGSGLALAGAPLMQACSSSGDNDAYEETIRRIWRPAQVASGDSHAIRRELVRYATLAPSSHNTQCWKFHLEPDAIAITPDLSRRTPCVDPDDHHLYVSLGCAAENLVQAALAHGLNAQPRFDPARGGRIVVAIEPTKAASSPLFQAIALRQSTRTEFDGKAVSSADLRVLERAGTGSRIQVILLSERAAMEKVLEHVVAANSAQMSDAAFVAELKQWIRFSSDEALRSGDGLYSLTSGNPSLPRWLGGALFSMLFTPAGENARYARQIRSSAGIAVFVSHAPAQSREDQRATWVEVGRAYERFALQATALGIRNAFINQPVEVATLRAAFASSLGVGDRRPDLVVRFGRGPAMPRALRRPLDEVLEGGGRG
jgi:hypothetical protein